MTTREDSTMLREGEPIEFDTTGLTYSGVHRDPDIFLRRLMTLLAKNISSLTLKTFSKLLLRYNNKTLHSGGIEVFLDEQLGKICMHCGHKHKE